MQYTIREATPHDGEVVSRIYAPYIASTSITFEEQPVDAQAMSRRIEETMAKYPFLVAQAGGEVIGYAFGTSHRARASYRWSTDVSVYLDSAHHRRGVGRALYGVLLPLLAAQGYITVHAGVTLPNAASVGLHERIGFKLVGVFPNVGCKFGTWRDVGWWSKQLNAPRPNPDEPIPWPQMPRLSAVIHRSAAISD